MERAACSGGQIDAAAETPASLDQLEDRLPRGGLRLERELQGQIADPIESQALGCTSDPGWPVS